MVNRSTMGIDGDTEDAGERTVVTIPIDHIVPSMGQYLVMLYQIFIIPIYNYISVFHILFHPIVGKSGQTGAMPGVALVQCQLFTHGLSAADPKFSLMCLEFDVGKTIAISNNLI